MCANWTVIPGERLYGVPGEPSWKPIDWSSFTHQAAVHGTQINYVDYGDGEHPPLLLLHGIGADWRSWLEVIPYLGTKRRVIAVDLPGFGASKDPGLMGAQKAMAYIEALCGVLGLEQIDVAGHSMGGFLALELMRSYPARIRRLILVAGAAKGVADLYQRPLRTMVERPMLVLRYIGLILMGSVPVPSHALRTVLSRPTLRRLACGPFVADAGALSEESLYQALSASGRLATLVTAVMGFSFKFDRTLREIEENGSPRVLIVSGDRDHMAAHRDVSAVAEMIYGADVVILESVAHWPMVEVPRELAPLMSEWLD